MQNLFIPMQGLKSKIKSSVWPLMDENGSIVGTNEEMAEVLNAFFASVFTNENTEKFPPVKQFHGLDTDKQSDFNITSDTVKQKLCKLKSNKSPGADSVELT